MRRRLLRALVAFVAMEPATYAAHRWVMHGVGWVLHRSHHLGRAHDLQARAAKLEANDAFPVIFASATMLTMAVGSRRPSRAGLVAVGAGITAYGAAYGFVHDVYIHARMGRLPRVSVLEWLKEAHGFHHAYGAEPYGMLLPVVPASVRARANVSAGAAREVAAAADGVHRPAQGRSAGPTPAGPSPAGPSPAGPTPAGPTPAGPTPAGPTPAGPTPAGTPARG